MPGIPYELHSTLHPGAQVASKRAAMADLLIHPWIAQYRTQKDAKIGAYHGVEQPVPAVQKQAPRVPSSVLDAAAVLSCTGSEQGDAQVALAETIRQVRQSTNMCMRQPCSWQGSGCSGFVLQAAGLARRRTLCWS